MSDEAPNILVAGASGYAGALAAQLVWAHPGLELARVTARGEVGAALNQLYPQYAVPLALEQLDLESLEDIGAAIVAYPHGASAPLVATLRMAGIPVVDLSADFRLHDLQTYERWYGEHPESHLLDDAVYGLPELYRQEIAGAGLVANPGCYPTASLLALAPLAAAGLVDDVVVDAKSGVSGAGRGAAEEMEAVKAGDDAMAYGVAGHRHSPEIAQELTELGMDGALLTFVPHLLPFDQGELVSCYVTPSRSVEQAELDEIYAARYEDEPFVEIAETPPRVGEVRDTNLCRVHVRVEEGSGRLMAFGAIDNLWKGAASQAVQNLNLMLGLPEGEGLS
ncbi:MAG: N-acetyl-gamma-glutamyl-phosphate reductase [Solirubrobacterales bacterium]